MRRCADLHYPQAIVKPSSQFLHICADYALRMHRYAVVMHFGFRQEESP